MTPCIHICVHAGWRVARRIYECLPSRSTTTGGSRNREPASKRREINLRVAPRACDLLITPAIDFPNSQTCRRRNTRARIHTHTRMHSLRRTAPLRGVFFVCYVDNGCVTRLRESECRIIPRRVAFSSCSGRDSTRSVWDRLSDDSSGKTPQVAFPSCTRCPRRTTR